MEERERKPVQRETAKKWIIIAAIAVVILLVAAFFGGQWIENRSKKPEQRGDANLRHEMENTPEITVDGETYRLRTNITTILFMGIDRPSDANPGNSYRNGGQADFLRLIVIDNDNKVIRQIAIDRDTMTPITILGVLGNRTGTRTERISLSHGFGKGREDSCKLTVDAVSNLFYGVPIDFYIAMNMDGVSEMNDLLGGIEVTLEDDFSAIDPAMTPGTTLILTGDQAEIFIRERMSIGVGTNESRMKRQQVYLGAAQQKLRAKIGEGTSAMEEFYDALSEYLITDFSKGRLINEAYAAKDYEILDPVQASGTHNVDAEGFMEFLADENDLQRIVLSVFYVKI